MRGGFVSSISFSVTRTRVVQKNEENTPKKTEASPWRQAAYGVTWLPISAAFQAASVGIGILKGWTDWAAVNEVFNPPICPLPIPVQDATCGTQNMLFDLDVAYGTPDNTEEQKQSLRDAVANQKNAQYDLVTRYVVQEEFIFRTLLQETLLKKAPKWALEKIAPSKVHWVDSKVAKVARIALSAAAFSAYHRGNQAALGLSDSQMNLQLCNTFGLGIATGILQEKTGSTWASIGLHLSYNILATAFATRKCY